MSMRRLREHDLAGVDGVGGDGDGDGDGGGDDDDDDGVRGAAEDGVRGGVKYCSARARLAARLRLRRRGLTASWKALVGRAGT